LARDLSGYFQLRPNQLNRQLVASVTCVMAKEAGDGVMLPQIQISPSRLQIEPDCKQKKRLENEEVTVLKDECQP
jgi:stringent starvation protein B